MKLQNWIDRIAAIGSVITAFSLACCLPLFAIAGAALGLSFIQSESRIIPYILQALFLLGLLGAFLTYRGHKNILPLVLIVSANVCIFYAYYATFSATFVYIGLLALVSGSIANYMASKKCGCRNEPGNNP